MIFLTLKTNLVPRQQKGQWNGLVGKGVVLSVFIRSEGFGRLHRLPLNLVDVVAKKEAKNLRLKNLPSSCVRNNRRLHEARTLWQLKKLLDHFLDVFDLGSLSNVNADALLSAHAHEEEVH
jgi:hypothetical protein